MSAAKEALETRVRQNKRIWEETLRECSNHEIKKAESITLSQSIVERITKKKNTIKKVLVLDSSNLDIARIACEKKMNPLIINAGNNNDPIKIVESGAIGPESDLMRRTNLGSAISSDVHYPIKAGSVLYIPGVTVFKNASYAMARPFKVSILTIPPVTRPSIVSIHAADNSMNEDYQNTSEREKMLGLIETMFQIAILKGHKCIIIDDFGCSNALGNPIYSVVEMFNEAMKHYPIKYVIFSIVESNEMMSAKKKRPDYKNYVVFNRHIQRPI